MTDELQVPSAPKPRRDASLWPTHKAKSRRRKSQEHRQVITANNYPQLANSKGRTQRPAQGITAGQRGAGSPRVRVPWLTPALPVRSLSEVFPHPQASDLRLFDTWSVGQQLTPPVCSKHPRMSRDPRVSREGFLTAGSWGRAGERLRLSPAPGGVR